MTFDDSTVGQYRATLQADDSSGDRGLNVASGNVFAAAVNCVVSTCSFLPEKNDEERVQPNKSKAVVESASAEPGITR